MSIVTLSCMKMGLIHDLAESIVGDITPVDNVSVEDKHTMERVGVVVDVHPKNAFLKIVSGFPEPLANEFVSLWEEYEKQESIMSHYVFDFDKLDMLIQANQYEIGKS